MFGKNSSHPSAPSAGGGASPSTASEQIPLLDPRDRLLLTASEAELEENHPMTKKSSLGGGSSKKLKRVQLLEPGGGGASGAVGPTELSSSPVGGALQQPGGAAASFDPSTSSSSLGGSKRQVVFKEGRHRGAAPAEGTTNDADLKEGRHRGAAPAEGTTTNDADPLSPSECTIDPTNAVTGSVFVRQVPPGMEITSSGAATGATTALENSSPGAGARSDGGRDSASGGPGGASSPGSEQEPGGRKTPPNNKMVFGLNLEDENIITESDLQKLSLEIVCNILRLVSDQRFHHMHSTGGHHGGAPPMFTSGGASSSSATIAGASAPLYEPTAYQYAHWSNSRGNANGTRWDEHGGRNWNATTRMGGGGVVPADIPRPQTTGRGMSAGTTEAGSHPPGVSPLAVRNLELNTRYIKTARELEDLVKQRYAELEWRRQSRIKLVLARYYQREEGFGNAGDGGYTSDASEMEAAYHSMLFGVQSTMNFGGGASGGGGGIGGFNDTASMHGASGERIQNWHKLRTTIHQTYEKQLCGP